MLSNCIAGEESLEFLTKKIKLVNPKGNQPWVFIGRMGVEAEAPIFWTPDAQSQLIRKDLDAEKDWKTEKETVEDEMIR